MATNKIQTGLRLEEQDLRKITHIAKQQKRSFNSLVEYLVHLYIEDYEKSHGAILPDEES